jgi:hypothetical protein
MQTPSTAPDTTGQHLGTLLPGNNRMLHTREMDVMRIADTARLLPRIRFSAVDGTPAAA